MVDEEGIRLVWYASTHHDSSAKPFGLQDVWLSLRGVHLTLLRTKRSISLRCAPVQCVDQTQMWLCGFLRLYHISWLLSKLCGSQLQHEAVLKDWSSGFQICFYTWEVMKYLGTVGTTVKIWHGWFFANDGGLEVGYLILVKSSLGKEGWDQMNG